VAFGLSNGAVVDENRSIEPIPSYLGWVRFDRVQFAGKYDFSFSIEKK
jgi:hypothetical protein